MYIKNIYDEWKLHHDATQLEINYNFLVKFIDILDVDVLLKTANELVINVQDKDVIREWKIFQINKLLEQFKEISNYDFKDIKWLNHSKIFIKSIFIAGYILNSLKNTNYKASELNSLYEPKLFTYAEKYLDLEILEEWISMLSKRIFEQNNANFNSIRTFDWSLSTDSKSLRNVTWYIENLLINFNDIAKWFKKVNADGKVLKNQKSCLINIMNHMIVYCLTDFYAKYYTEITNDKYLKIYQDILNEIAIDVNNHTFAIISFKQISSFLNFLLNKKSIENNDVMIVHYLDFISICCSEKNISILKEILFQVNVDVEIDDVTYDNKIDVDNEIDEGLPNQETNPIELDCFENYRTYKTTLLESDTTHDNNEVPINATDEIPIVSYKTTIIDAAIDSNDETDTTNVINMDDVANQHQTEKTNILKNITKPLQTFKNIFGSGTQKTNNNSEYKQNTKQTIETNIVQEEVDEYE